MKPTVTFADWKSSGLVLIEFISVQKEMAMGPGTEFWGFLERQLSNMETLRKHNTIFNSL